MSVTTDNLEQCHSCARAVKAFPKCPASGAPLLIHAEAGYCPLPQPRFGDGVRPVGFGQVPAEVVENAARRLAEAAERQKVARGREAWATLHTEGWGQDAVWLAEWEKAIPCGECRSNYDALKAANPPTFPLTFAWGHTIHEAVNAHLDKSPVSLEEARRLWKPGVE